MTIYSIKSLKYSFAILAPEHSIGLIKGTKNSIDFHYPGSSVIAVVESKTTKEEIEDIKKICPVYKGKETITSLINVGMRHATGEWVFTIFAGTTLRPKLDQKFGFFVASDKDVIYPVADGKFNFLEATLNGLFINKKFYKEVGEMQDDGPLEMVKAEWAMAAMDKGCKFKAVIGSKMC